MTGARECQTRFVTSLRQICVTVEQQSLLHHSNNPILREPHYFHCTRKQMSGVPVFFFVSCLCVTEMMPRTSVAMSAHVRPHCKNRAGSDGHDEILIINIKDKFPSFHFWDMLRDILSLLQTLNICIIACVFNKMAFMLSCY